MLKKAMALLLIAGLAVIAAAAYAQQESKPCPWKISSIAAGKWANGNHKAGLWAKGSFPINIPGVTERPDWYINGTNVGKSQIQFDTRFIPNSSGLLKPGTNTVKVQFNKQPYNGASHTITFDNFNWDDVPPGGYKWFK